MLSYPAVVVRIELARLRQEEISFSAKLASAKRAEQQALVGLMRFVCHL